MDKASNKLGKFFYCFKEEGGGYFKVQLKKYSIRWLEASDLFWFIYLLMKHEGQALSKNTTFHTKVVL